MSIQPSGATTDLMRLPEVSQAVGLSKTEIYRKIKRGEFPPQKRVGHRTAYWSRRQVTAWANSVFDPEIESLLG